MKRERAIVVTNRMPWPLDDGGRIDMWQSLWICSRGWDVTIVTLVEPGTEHEPPPAPIQALGSEVVCVPHRPLGPALAALQSLAGPWPYPIVRHRSRRLEGVLREQVAARKPAVVWLNQLHTATDVDALRGTTVVLRQQNVEHVFLERVAANLRTPWERLYARQQARRMRVLEASLCTRSDLVLAVQDLERDLLRGLAPEARVETLPIGVDFSRFAPRAPESPPVALLTGSFGWPPNAEGAARFLAAGWPRIRARVPGARLRLAGKGLSEDLASQSRLGGAEPVGYVPDIGPEFARASVMVVPLWVAAGARVKIIEAMAAGLPVISTAIGAEGLGLVPGRHYLQAETPEDLGNAAAELLLDAARASALAAEAHDHARRHFSLESVATRGSELVAEAVARRARGAR